MPCQSTRANRGQLTSTRFQDETFLNSISDPEMTLQESILAYNAAVHMDYDTGIINGINDPWAYAASHKLNDPDNPSFNEAMFGKESDKYIKAMQKEIVQLVKQKT